MRPLLFAALALAAAGRPAPAADDGSSKPGERRTVGIKYFGEAPGGHAEPAPEAGDFRENWGRNAGSAGGAAPDRDSAGPSSPRDTAAPGRDGAASPLPRNGPDESVSRSVGSDRAVSEGVAQGRGVSEGLGAPAPEGRRDAPAGAEARRPSDGQRPPDGRRPPDAAGPGPRVRDGLIGAVRGQGAKPGGGADAAAPKAQRLWKGLNSGLSMPSRKAAEASDEEALAAGRDDYGRLILGLSGEGGRPARDQAPKPKTDGAQAPDQGRDLMVGPQLPKAVSSEPELQPSGSIPDISGQSLFVNVELDIADKPGDYRDAVAQLSRTSGFSVDPRFPAAYASARKERVHLWGWMLTDKLGDAVRSPGLKRIEIERPGLSEAGRRQVGLTDTLVALRLPPDGRDAEEFLLSAMRRLSENTGFAWKRTVGVQPLADSRELAIVVAGSVPLRNMSRVLADEAVVKVLPLPGQGQAGREGRAPLPRTPRQFLDFALTRRPALFFLAVALTIAGFWQALQRRRGGKPSTRARRP